MTAPRPETSGLLKPMPWTAAASRAPSLRSVPRMISCVPTAVSPRSVVRPSRPSRLMKPEKHARTTSRWDLAPHATRLSRLKRRQASYSIGHPILSTLLMPTRKHPLWKHGLTYPTIIPRLIFPRSMPAVNRKWKAHGSPYMVPIKPKSTPGPHLTSRTASNILHPAPTRCAK